MRFTFRLLGAIWLSAVVIGGGFALLSIRDERSRRIEDLDRRAQLVSEGLKVALEPLIEQGFPARFEGAARKLGTRVQAIAVYDHFGALIVATPDPAQRLSVTPPFVAAALASGDAQRGVEVLGGRDAYYYAVPLAAAEGGEPPGGVLVIVQDASRLRPRLADIVRHTATRYLVLASALSLLILLVVRWSITAPLLRLAEWARQLRTGRVPAPLGRVDTALFGPLATEVKSLATSLAKARAAAEQEALLRLQGETVWTEERLKQVVTGRLQDRPLVVVSNREPLTHVWQGRRIEVVTPASGVVTALDPVMRACGGVWVAHGSGDADAEVVDARDTVRVPPEDPRYTLKRVWLTKAEEDGYYYGFANEGLWPLCHIVHARPTFRPEDWAQYAAVNQKFADAVLKELAGTEAPVLLIQDYHFALLPRLVREARPDARIAIFWHIPWPNPEAFGICPWQAELLQGMLGADLIGFHTQFHCNNFLETVDRAIEARLDWEQFSVVRGAHTTEVKPFPISVAPAFVEDPPKTTRAALLAELGISAEFLGVGVERLDYTKGLPERMRALRRFFERYPAYRERLTFVQLAAPSRSQIPRYREIADEVERAIEEVNGALQTAQWRPILYLKAHHSHRDIWPYYRWADFCLVTALHDGMNLVAKEFVSTREDDDGVLILSRFTGAARELRDALLVNPYDLDGMADAIHTAVEMPPEERRGRMARMRQTVLEHNIYRWAGLLLGELSRFPVAGRARPATRSGGEAASDRLAGDG